MSLKIVQGAPAKKYGDNCDVGEVISFRPDSRTHTIISVNRRQRRLYLDDDSNVSMSGLFYLHTS